MSLRCFEVGGHLGGHFDDHFGFGQVQPNAVFLFQRFHDGWVLPESLICVGKRRFDFGECVALELVLIDCSQVPNALVVDELVGLRLWVTFGTVGFEIPEPTVQQRSMACCNRLKVFSCPLRSS